MPFTAYLRVKHHEILTSKSVNDMKRARHLAQWQETLEHAERPYSSRSDLRFGRLHNCYGRGSCGSVLCICVEQGRRLRQGRGLRTFCWRAGADDQAPDRV